MHKEDIKSAIRKKGATPAKLARELDVSHCAVSLIISGKSRSKRIENRISEVTGIPLNKLWPQWYQVTEAA